MSYSIWILDRFFWRQLISEAFIRKLLCIIVCWLFCVAASAGELAITFFDVGQADAALITTPAGKQVLIDGGSEPRTLDTGETVFSREVLPLLRERGVTRLDAVIVSHPHPDHISGILAILSTMTVTRVYVPACAENDPELRQCLQLARARRVECVAVRAGARIPLDPAARVEVFGPPENFCFGDANDNSLIMRIGYKKVGVLFTGDANTEAQDWCAGKYGSRLRSTAMKIPHHGSYNAVNGTFIRAVNPAAAVISSGENPYGHPHGKTLSFYEKEKTTLYRTDRQGSLRFVTDGITYSVLAEKP